MKAVQRLLPGDLSINLYWRRNMFIYSKFEKTLPLVTFSILCMVLALLTTAAYAQDAVPDEVLIDRDPAQLSDLLIGGAHPRPDLAPFLDTAMALTNVGADDTLVRCHARNRQGDIVGRVRVNVPAMGLRFFLASDIVEQRGFVGSVICLARSHVVGTEVMLGVVHTDIQVHQDFTAGWSTLLFPVSAMR